MDFHDLGVSYEASNWRYRGDFLTAKNVRDCEKCLCKMTLTVQNVCVKWLWREKWLCKLTLTVQNDYVNWPWLYKMAVEFDLEKCLLKMTVKIILAL